MNQATAFDSLSLSQMQGSIGAILQLSDISIAVGPGGWIEDASLGADTHPNLVPESLNGRPVQELAAAPDMDAVSDLVTAAWEGQTNPSAIIRHGPLMNEGSAARYTAHLTRDGQHVLLVGQWLGSAHTIPEGIVEAEISQHQSNGHIESESEARYKLLFQSSVEAILFVDPATGEIEEANAHVGTLIGQSATALAGRRLRALLAPEDREALDTALGNALAEADQLMLDARLAGTGWKIRLQGQVVRSFERVLLMLRLSRPKGEEKDRQTSGPALAVELLRRTEIPVALTDRIGTINWINDAFRTYAGARPALGHTLMDVLGMSEHALDVGFRQAIEHGRVLLTRNALSAGQNVEADAHITLVSVPENDPTGFGLLFRRMPVKGTKEIADQPGRPSQDAIADLVGHAPLKSLVRESTDVIERACIDAALRLTGNNRAAAANVLGLSRQSLYVKLRQHDLL